MRRHLLVDADEVVLLAVAARRSPLVTLGLSGPTLIAGLLQQRQNRLLLSSSDVKILRPRLPVVLALPSAGASRMLGCSSSVHMAPGHGPWEDTVPARSCAGPARRWYGAREADMPSAGGTPPAQNGGSPRGPWIDRPGAAGWHPRETESVPARCWDARTAHRGGSAAAPDSAGPRRHARGWAVERDSKTTGAGRRRPLHKAADTGARRTRRAHATGAAAVILRAEACGAPGEAEGRRRQGAVCSCRQSRSRPSSVV